MNKIWLGAIIMAGLFGSALWQVAEAQDAACAKAKNPNHRKSCNCFAGGGRAAERGNGDIVWFPSRSGASAQIQNCLNSR